MRLQKDEKSYDVIIDRKSSIKLRLLEDGEDISSHTATNTYKTLQDIIGIDFKTFSQLVYQNTNSSLQFLTATDTNRKKFLIDLLHLEHYVQYFELFKEEARKRNINLSSTESTIATIEKWLTDNKLKDTTILPLSEISIETEEDEKELATLTNEIENISEKNKKILRNNNYKDMLAKIDITEAQNCSIKSIESYDELQSELGTLSGVAAGSKRLLDKLSKLGDHCPTCEQEVDSDFVESLISVETTKIESAKRREDDIKRRIEEIKRNNAEFSAARKTQKDWEDLFRSIDNSLPALPLDPIELKARAENISDRISSAKDELLRVSRENESITKRNTRIQVILEQTEKFQTDLEEATEVLEAEKEIASNLEVLKKALAQMDYLRTR